MTIYPTIPIMRCRIHIPHEFAPPGTPVFLTAGPTRCLLLFRYEKWAPIQERLLKSFDKSSEKDVLILRLLLGNQAESKVSLQRTIGLPLHLRTFAHIQYCILWVPAKNGIELWNPAAFSEEKRFLARQENPDPACSN